MPEIVQIGTGQLEYETAGIGPAVLVSHGTLGGYDQALAIASLFDLSKNRFVAISRAGYLRSTVETGPTPQKQAESYTLLLDKLGIEKASMMGVSGGAPSALHFAQNFPDRCHALVLLSAIAFLPPPPPPAFRVVLRWQNTLMGVDTIWKPFAKYGLSLSMRMNGVSASQIEEIRNDAGKLSAARGIFAPVATASQRRLGAANDSRIIESLPKDGYYDVRVPLFISHCVNDPLASVNGARQLAELLPDAHYLEYEDGGHIFFVVHRDSLVPEVEQFLTGQLL